MADNKGFAALLREKLESLSDMSSQPCIYKAPDYFQEENEECYRPSVISIGPFYYGLPSLEAMQDCKIRCLEIFLKHECNLYKSDLEHYLRIVRELEGNIRSCYAENINLPSDEFTGMILMDSIFIICICMKFDPILEKSTSPSLSDIIKRNLFKWNSKLRRDLFLEENQVPFFILKRLFNEAFSEDCPNTSFLDLACKYVAEGTPSAHVEDISCFIIKSLRNESVKILHLVDLLWHICVPFTLRKQAVELTSSTNIVFPSSLTNLRALGVKVVARKGAMSFFDIAFSNGVLEIPAIEIWDISESYFRSMIFFEQSHQPINDKSYIFHYIVLLEKLIRTPEDMQILVESGIIGNWIGSEETIERHFNGGLTKHIALPINFYYVGVCQDLNVYTNTRWNHYKAILKRDYFCHPWAAISLIYWTTDFWYFPAITSLRMCCYVC